jgi:hypothetical protein
MARRFPEPALLFHQTGRGTCDARWDVIIGGAAQQRDCPQAIQSAQLLAPQTLQFRAGRFPSLHPAPTKLDLVRRPIRQIRCFCFHIVSLAGFGNHCQLQHLRAAIVLDPLVIWTQYLEPVVAQQDPIGRGAQQDAAA